MVMANPTSTAGHKHIASTAGAQTTSTSVCSHIGSSYIPACSMSLSVSLPPSASEKLPPAVESSDDAQGTPGSDMALDDLSADLDSCIERPPADDDELLSALDEDPEFVDIVAEGVDTLHLAIDGPQALVVPLPTVAAHLTSSQDFAEFLTLRVSPPAHPEMMPRRIEVMIREVREHTE